MRRLLDLIKGLLALAVLVALVVGVPAALLTVAGHPIGDLRQAVTGQLLSDDSRVSFGLRGGFTLVVWLAWAQLVYALAVETVAVARGRIARRAPVLPGIQLLARKLVVTALLVGQAFAASTSALSALAPLAVPSAIEHHELSVLPPVGAAPDLAPSRGGAREAAQPARVTHLTVAGDTFWSLAESFLGDGVRWTEVREANLGRTMPDGTTITTATEVVRPGWELLLPAGAVAPAVAPALAPAGPTVAAPGLPTPPAPAEVLGRWNVHHGDNFWVIAKQTLTATYGRTPTDAEIRPYWQELVELNRGRLATGDANLIFPGQTFERPLPAGVTAAPRAVATVATGISRPGIDSGTGSGSGGAAGSGADLGAGTDAGPGGTGSGSGGGPEEGSRFTVVAPPGDPQSPQALPAPVHHEVPDGRTNEGITLGLLGTAIGAGTVVTQLRRRRRQDAARRQPGSGSGNLPAGLGRVESRVRAVADTEAVRWLEATNGLLSTSLSRQPDRPLPAVLAVRAGEFGVEVLLDEACPPPWGFLTSNPAGTSWRLDPDLDLDQVEAAAAGARPFAPALAVVGGTEAGELLVDLEQLAVLSLTGDGPTALGWMTTIATALRSAAWSRDVRVVAVGLDPALDAAAGVVVPADLAGWAKATEDRMRATAAGPDGSPYRQRVAGRSACPPTVVLLGPGYDELARRLAEVAALAHSPLVLITTSELPGAARVELSPGHGAIVPDASGLRLDFLPVTTSAEAARAAAELLGSGSAPGLADVPDTVRRRPLPVDPAAGLHGSDVAWPPPPVSPGSLLLSTPTPPPAPAPALSPASAGSVVLTGAGPEVTVLAARPRVTGVSGLTPESEAALAYLATVGSATAADVAGSIGLAPGDPGAADRLLRTLADGLNPAAGAPVVAFDPVTLRWSAGDGLGSDWRRVTSLLARAGQAADPAEQMGLLVDALGLIEGPPGAEAPGRQYRWLQPDSDVYTGIETALVDAAHQLGELALGHGRPRRAAWAAERGLVVVPAQEALHRIQMKAAALQANPAGVEQAYRNAARALEALAAGGVQPETTALYQRLTTSPG